jgi:hypothetical protein
MNEILNYIKQRGECPATEIAQVTNIPLTEVYIHLAELKATNQIMLCDSTTFLKGKEVRSTICRISGYIPPAKPGAKSKKQLVL